MAKRKEEGSAVLAQAKTSLSLFIVSVVSQTMDILVHSLLIITNQGMVRSSGYTCAIYPRIKPK